MIPSLAMQLAMRPDTERRAILAQYTPEQIEAMLHDWRFKARGEQLPPAGDWRTWLVLAGRGFGKSWVGANWCNEQAERNPSVPGLVTARSAGDVRETCIEGPSGILAQAKPGFRPKYEPSKRKLSWPNGAWALAIGADEPDLFRGKNTGWAWADELAAWRYSDSWDQLQLGLRLGDPKCVVTTTPRPTALIRDLMKDPHTIITRGGTKDNAANLAPAFLAQVIKRYEGTMLGRQELDGEMLDDIPGALWKRPLIDGTRVLPQAAPKEFKRIVTAIDPAATSGESSDDTGIIVMGLGNDGHGYVLADATCHESPNGWGRRAVTAHHLHKGDRILGEVNHGGEMIEFVLRTVDPSVPYKSVSASRGKQARAEPISALYEQGRIHHVGVLRDLEDEMCGWVPGVSTESPNRVDALVWAATELMGAGEFWWLD